MARYLLEHRHEPHECGVVFAAFKGHESPLRHRPTLVSCRSGGHAIWWTVEAESEEEAPATTWGSATEELVRIGRVIVYDRRGYARSGGEPPRSVSLHTADAAATLESFRLQPAVVVGTSAGASIAVDLAVRRPDLVRAVVAHEGLADFLNSIGAGSKGRATRCPFDATAAFVQVIADTVTL